MEEEKLTFKITLEDGKTVDCEVFCTFVGKETKKNYMIYTDNTFDEEGNQKCYAGIYDPEKLAQGLEQSLLPIETEEEWQMVEEILNTKAALDSDQE